MLQVSHSKLFDKHFDALSEKLKAKTLDRLHIFMLDEYAGILNNHQLHGEYMGCRSINITGDVRLIYKKLEEGFCRLVNIGTHSQLFE